MGRGRGDTSGVAIWNILEQRRLGHFPKPGKERSVDSGGLCQVSASPRRWQDRREVMATCRLHVGIVGDIGAWERVLSSPRRSAETMVGEDGRPLTHPPDLR